MDENVWLVEQANKRKNKKNIFFSVIVLLVVVIAIFFTVKSTNLIRLSNNVSDLNSYTADKSLVSISFVSQLKSIKSDKGFLEPTNEAFDQKVELILMDKKTELQLANLKGNLKESVKLESSFPKQFIELNFTNLNEGFTLDSISLLNKSSNQSEEIKFEQIAPGKYKSNTFVVLTNSSYEVQFIFKSFISISGQVFLDENSNDIKDINEVGIGKRIVSIVSAEGNIINSSFTAEDGGFELGVEQAGKYSVRVDGDGNYIPKETINSNLKYDDFLVSYKQSPPFEMGNEEKPENINLGLVVFTNELKERLIKGERQ